jgi:hypothetical protein
MINLAVDVQFVTEASEEQLEAFLDSVLEHLAELGYEDVDLVASLAEHHAEFLMGIRESEVEDRTDAGIQLLGALRTAFHANMCATPAWPEVRATEEEFRTVEDDELLDA